MADRNDGLSPDAELDALLSKQDQSPTPELLPTSAPNLFEIPETRPETGGTTSVSPQSTEIIDETFWSSQIDVATKASEDTAKQGGLGFIGSILPLSPEETQARLKEQGAAIATQRAALPNTKVIDFGGASLMPADPKDPAFSRFADQMGTPQAKALAQSVIKGETQRLDREQAVVDRLAKVPGVQLPNRVTSFIESVPAGTVDTVGAVVEGLGIGAGYAGNATGMNVTSQQNSIAAVGRWIKAKSKEYFPGDPLRQEEFETNLARGIGSTAGFWGVSAAAYVARLTRPWQIAATAATGAFASGSQTYNDAVNSEMAGRDVSDQQKLAAYLGGLAFGASEAAPIARNLHGLSPRTRNEILSHLATMGREGFEETLQEGFQGIGQNLIANIHSDRPLFEGVDQAMMIGFLSGGLVTGGRIAASQAARVGSIAENRYGMGRGEQVVNRFMRQPEALRPAGDAPRQQVQPPQVGTSAVDPKSFTINLDQYVPQPKPGDYPAPAPVPSYDRGRDIAASARMPDGQAVGGRQIPVAPPTYAEIMSHPAFPIDENGDPDSLGFQDTLQQLTGKRFWNQLSGEEKIAAERVLEAGQLPTVGQSAPQAAGGAVTPVPGAGGARQSGPVALSAAAPAAASAAREDVDVLGLTRSNTPLPDAQSYDRALTALDTEIEDQIAIRDEAKAEIEGMAAGAQRRAKSRAYNEARGAVSALESERATLVEKRDTLAASAAVEGPRADPALEAAHQAHVSGQPAMTWSPEALNAGAESGLVRIDPDGIPRRAALPDEGAIAAEQEQAVTGALSRQISDILPDAGGVIEPGRLGRKVAMGNAIAVRRLVDTLAMMSDDDIKVQFSDVARLARASNRLQLVARAVQGAMARDLRERENAELSNAARDLIEQTVEDAAAGRPISDTLRTLMLDQVVTGVVDEVLAVTKHIVPERNADVAEQLASVVRDVDLALVDDVASTAGQTASQISDTLLGVIRGSAERIAGAAGVRAKERTIDDIIEQAAPTAAFSVEENILPLEEIVNPIDASASPDKKLERIHALTAVNQSVLDRQLRDLDARIGTSSKSSAKADATILEKAKRPSIIAKKPWHDIEHIRDTLRFKTVITSFDQIERAADVMLGHGYKIIKIDTDKMLHPKEWGWRFAGFDLRAPNGQMIEWYIVFDTMEVAKKSGGGHLLFEKWRQKSSDELAVRVAEYRDDVRRSYMQYEQAFQQGLLNSGYADFNDAVADITNLSASLPEMAAKFSAKSSAVGGENSPSASQGPSGLERNADAPSPITQQRPDASSSSTTVGDSILLPPVSDNMGGSGPEIKDRDTAAKVLSTLNEVGTDAGLFHDLKTRYLQPGRGGLTLADLGKVARAYGADVGRHRSKKDVINAIESEFNRRSAAADDAAILSGDVGVITREGEQRAVDRRAGERNQRLRESQRALSDGVVSRNLSGDGEGRDAGGASAGDRRGGGDGVSGDGAAGPGEDIGGRAALRGDGPSPGKSNTAGGQRDGDDRNRARAAAVEAATQAEAEREERRRKNYRITDDDALGAGGPKAKVRGNIDAIRLVRLLEDEKRPATEDEKKRLIKYVGWGAFAQDVFSDHKSEWTKERQQLLDLLTAEEYAAAKASTLNAHYTSKDVIDGMWAAMEHFGFDGGRAIEPASGIGHFIGLAPEKIAARTDWVAVELDHITGAIARHLYEGSDVRVQGFEKATLPGNFFDLAISNVPFGDFKIEDRDHKGLLIHDFFFAKSLDKVRPGGMVAFITSMGTMDKSSERVRRLIDDKADLVGAIRLPGGNQGAFKGNAGTDVTTDIIFLRKRVAGEPRSPDAPKWMDLVEIKTPEGKTSINRYFAEHPDMMLGKMRLQGSMYRKDSPVLIGPSTNLGQRILDAAQKMPGGVFTPRTTAATDVAAEPEILTDVGVKEGSFFVKGGKIYQNIAGKAVPQNATGKDLTRLRGLIAMRDIVTDLLNAQIVGGERASLPALRDKLNAAYDAFVAKFGPINKTIISSQVRKAKDGETKEIVTRRYPNLAGFQDDPDYLKLASIENYSEETGAAGKKAIFNEDVLVPYVRPQVSGAVDALSVSLNETGMVDIARIADMLGVTHDQAVSDLGDRVFLNPNGEHYELAELYLSGDVVRKLDDARAAAMTNDAFKRNVIALEAVQPDPLTRVDIRVTFGAPWVPDTIYNEFVAKVIGLRGGSIKYERTTSSWNFTDADALRRNGYANVAAQDAFGTSRSSVSDILLAALNGKAITITDTHKNQDGSTSEVPNIQATEDVRAKIKLIKETFSGEPTSGLVGWIYEDEARAQAVEAIYNQQFNRIVPTKYDGSHLTLPGLAATLTLPSGKVVPLDRMPHRLNAIWRAITSGNLLMDHAVGSGKTITSVAAAMEQKRLGIIQRPMFVVPNHMLEQFGREFLEAYPNAKILVADKKSMDAKNRQAFAARIAAEKWDGIIITHSAFGRMPLRDAAYKEFIEEELAEIVDVWLEAKRAAGEKDDGKPSRNTTVKQIERKKKALEAQLDALVNRDAKDEGIAFEELGVDYLVVDEAHMFKNLTYNTSHTNVKGVGVKGSQRAMDLFLKIRQIEKMRPGRSAIFMTGTPMSRSMAEIYTMQRYLQLDTLREYGVDRFDAWAATFGSIVTNTEQSVNMKLKDVASFSKFVNVPELQTIYSRVADSMTAEQLKLPRPEIKGGAPQVVLAQMSAAEIAETESLIRRMENLKGPAKKGQDNHLSLFTATVQIATDMRLYDMSAPFNPHGKIARLVDKVSDIYKRGKAPALAQTIFLDMGVPTAKSARPSRKADLGDDSQIDIVRAKLAGDDVDPDAESDAEVGAMLQGKFNLYQDIKDRLVAAGVPAKEIAFIHDAKTDMAKAKLFKDVREGKVRVLLGSSSKMGVGTNVQRFLIAQHHVDAPWNPADLVQRDGRILRRGNENPEVEIYRYITERSADAYRWQTLARKADFEAQFRAGARGLREAEDIDSPIPEASTLKALATGDPRIMEHAQLTREVRDLEAARRGHERSYLNAQRSIGDAKTRLAKNEKAVIEYQADSALVSNIAGDAFKIRVDTPNFVGETDKRKRAGEAIRQYILEQSRYGYDRDFTAVKVGQMSGFEMMMHYRRTADGIEVRPTLRAAGEYFSNGGAKLMNADSDPVGIVRAFENILLGIPSLAQNMEVRIGQDKALIASLEARSTPTPFPNVGRLAAAKARHEQLDRELRSITPENQGGEATTSVSRDENAGVLELAAFAPSLGRRLGIIMRHARDAARVDAILDTADDGTPFIGDKESRYQEDMRLHNLRMAVMEELNYGRAADQIGIAGSGLWADGQGGENAEGLAGPAAGNQGGGQRSQIGQALAADPALRAQALEAFLSPEIRSGAIEARANAQGFVLAGYHGTQAGIFDNPNAFVPGRDFGFHVGLGTPKAANSRLGFPSTFAEHLDRFLSRMFGVSNERSPEDGAVMPVRIRVSNPLRLPDVGAVGGSMWSDPVAIARALAHPDSAAPESLKRWVKQWIADNGALVPDRGMMIARNHIFSRAFAAELDRLGYDAIIYKNTVEGVGHDSLFVWDASRVRSANDFYHDDAVGATGLMASNDYVEQDLADRLEVLMREEGMEGEQEIYDFSGLAAFSTFKKPVRSGDRNGHVIMRRLADKNGKPFLVRVVEDFYDDLVIEMYDDKLPGVSEDALPRGVSKYGKKLGYVNLSYVGIGNFRTHGHRGPLYEVSMVSVDEEQRMRGLAKATYNMLEDMLGTEMMPSGQLLEDGYKHWLKRNPDLVRGHQYHRDDEMYYSPKHIKQHLDDAERDVENFSMEEAKKKHFDRYLDRQKTLFDSVIGYGVPEETVKTGSASDIVSALQSADLNIDQLPTWATGHISDESIENAYRRLANEVIASRNKDLEKDAAFLAQRDYEYARDELKILRGMWRKVPKDLRSKKARDAMFSFIDQIFSFAPAAQGNLRLTPAAKAAYPEIVADLETRLARMLPQGVALRFAERLFHSNGREMHGRFRPDVKLIELALAHGPEKALQTGAHEIVHVLRDAGAFTDAEWSALVERAKKTVDIDQVIYRDVYRAQAQKMKLSHELTDRFVARRIEEELVAKLAEAHVSPANPSFGEKIDALLKRITDILAAIVEAFGAQGFTTPERTFRRMERGEIARRVEAKKPSQTATVSKSQDKVDDVASAAGLWSPADGPTRAFAVPGGEGQVTIFDRADGFQNRIYRIMDEKGRATAAVALAERDVNQFEIVGLRLAKEVQGRGLTRKLLTAIEDDMGRPVVMTGIVTPEAYAELSETSPEKIRFHVQGGKAFDGLYLSPDSIAAMHEGSGADSTDDIVAKERRVIGLLQQAVPDEHFAIERSVGEMAAFKERGAGLDMSPEARKARAEAMGFDTSRQLYHGTKTSFDGFNGNRIFLTDNRDVAEPFAVNLDNNFDGGQIFPVYAKTSNAKTYKSNEFYGDDDIFRLVDEAESEGFDVVIFQHGPGGKTRLGKRLEAYDEIVVFDARNIRSVNAAFDPAKADSQNLLASLADSRETHLRDMQKRVGSGQSVSVDRAIVAQSLESMMPYRAMLPKGTDIAAVTNVAPSQIGNRYVDITVEIPSGSTFVFHFPRRDAFRLRAAYVRDLDLVVSFHLGGVGAGQDIGKSSRGELAHEMVHALWRNGSIPTDVRHRLLAHAKTLRVLQSDLKTYLGIIGQKSSPDVDGTLEEAYQAYYASQYQDSPGDLADVMDQEYVAHFVELYVHGWWSNGEIAAVKADLDAMLSGTFTGRSSKVLARMPRIAAAFGGQTPHLPSLGNMARGEVVDPGQGLSDLIELAIEAIGTENRRGRLNPGLKAAMGKLGAKLYGQYSRGTGVIRTAIPNDLPTLLHEGGHALENHIELGANVEGVKNGFSGELMPLASPGQDQLSEGFAEFFRMFVVEPTRTRQVAPGAEMAFRNMLEAQAPELLQTLEAIQSGYATLIEASPAGALLSRTKSTKREDETLRDELKEKGVSNAISDRLYAFTKNYVDEKHPLKMAVRTLLDMATERIGGRLTSAQRLAVKAINDPYKLARMMEHARVHATAVLQHGIKRKGRALPTGPSMRDVMAEAFGGLDKKSWNDERFQQFGAYLIARRMNAEWDRFEGGELENVPDPLMSRDAWGKALTDLENAFPEFRKAAAKFDAFAANALEWKFENGFLTQETYDSLKTRSGWAPLNRIMDDDKGPSSLKAKGNNKRKLIFRFRGSSRDFINPIESIIADIYQTQARVELNDVIKALDHLARAAGPNGGLIAERIPAHDMLGKTFNLENQLDAMRKQSEKVLESAVQSGAIASWDADRVLDELDLMFDQSKAVTLFEATATGERGEKIVYLWENGKRVPILLGSDQLGEDIFNIFAGVGKLGEMGAGLSHMVFFTQMFRAGVTKSPAYIAVNWFRDQLATWVLSKHFNPFWTGLRGLGDVVKGDDAVTMYQSWAGMSGVETNLIEGMGGDRDAMLLRKNGFFAAPTTWQAMMRTMEVTELASRVGHMKAAFDNYMADGYSEEEAAFEAAYNSHDVMDFSMRGSKMLQAARLIAFMNAQIQGMYAALRTLKGERDDVVTIRDAISPYLKATEGQPLSVVDKKALPNSMIMWVKLASIGLIGLALKSLYRDDPEHEELSKGDMGFTHWFFKVGGHWYRVPKPFELAIFSNLLEAAFDKVEKNDPLAMQRFMLSVRETMFLSPEIQVAGSMTSLYSTLVLQPLDKITGKPQYGGANSKDLPQRFRGLPPEMQWDAYTSELSKMLAAQFGISPHKTDNVIRGMFASVGRDALTVSDYVLPRVNMAVGGNIPGVAKQPRADKSVEDSMVISRVMRRASRSGYSTTKFWEDMNYDTGRFVTASKGYKRLMSEQRSARDAQEFLSGLDPERRAYAMLEYHYKEKDQDMHPLNRAQQVILAINGVRRQMANETLFVERTKKKHNDNNDKIAVPPSGQRVINEILEDMAMREARNAQIVLGKPGFGGAMVEMPTDGLWRELRAAAPDVAEELYWRLTHGRHKTYSFEAVKKVWPEVREQLLSQPPGTSLAAPRSSARIETPLQLPTLELPAPP